MSDFETTIETARLRMRKPRIEDFSASAAMWADPEIVRHISGTPSTVEASWSRSIRYAGHWTIFGFGYWIVEELQSNAFVGEVGFAYHRREITPPIGVPEIGWVLARSAHGQGYATEAVRAAIGWAQRHIHTDKIACLIAPGNVASIRVAEKCGFALSSRTSYANSPALIYRRPLRSGGGT